MVIKRFTVFSFLLALFVAFGSATGYSQTKEEKKAAKKEAKAAKKDAKGKGKKNSGGDDVVWKGSPAKIMEQANYYYSLFQWATAKEGYMEVLKKDPANYLATYRVAECSFRTQAYEDAVRYYQGALDIDKEKNDTIYFKLGRSLRILNRHRDAAEQFEIFRKRWKGDDTYYRMVKLELAGCKMVDSLMAIKPEMQVRCIDINTSSGDQFPAILKQNEEEKYLVFTSHRAASMGNTDFAGYDEVSRSDLWICKIENDTTFANPENLGKPINTKNNDGSVTFSPDGLTMYYSICNMGKLGFNCTIYSSQYNAQRKVWGKPEIVEAIQSEVEIVVNTRGKTKKAPTYDVHPSVSPDGNYLFFVSDREGGYGELDIWYSTKEGETWSEPVNAGPRINSPFDEFSPSFNKDATRLYFSSNGRIGVGGFDIYYCEGGVGAWGEPVNAGMPLNSSYDDFGIVWFNDDSSSYFTSNRPDCKGRDDLWFAKKNKKPDITVAVQGEVVDKKSRQVIPFATVILFEKDRENELIPLDTFRTDQSGHYNFDLDPEKNYKVVGNAPEYLANEVEFNTFVDATTMLEIDIDIELERIIIDFPIILNNIYYDFDQFFLRDDAKFELDKLVDLLRKNPHITIKIGSHTDSNGSEPYNKTLSENRAKSAMEYLIEQGIAPDRLTWFGYGESQLLIYPEKSDEDEQVNRRSEFRILTIDYQAK